MVGSEGVNGVCETMVDSNEETRGMPRISEDIVGQCRCAMCGALTRPVPVQASVEEASEARLAPSITDMSAAMSLTAPAFEE